MLKDHNKLLIINMNFSFYWNLNGMIFFLCRSKMSGLSFGPLSFIDTINLIQYRYNFIRNEVRVFQPLSHFTTETEQPFLFMIEFFRLQKDKTDLNKYLYFLTLLRSIKRAFEQGVCKDTIFATIRITAFFFFNFTL